MTKILNVVVQIYDLVFLIYKEEKSCEWGSSAGEKAALQL